MAPEIESLKKALENAYELAEETPGIQESIEKLIKSVRKQMERLDIPRVTVTERLTEPDFLFCDVSADKTVRDALKGVCVSVFNGKCVTSSGSSVDGTLIFVPLVSADKFV